MNNFFRKFASKVSELAGTSWAFILAVMIITVWGLTGPAFNYSDTWQLIINTGTTIVTFLMVFLIQNTQNRDAKAIHLKLDELIKATRGARNTMIDLDKLTDDQLKRLETEYKQICDMDGDDADGNTHPLDRVMQSAQADAQQSVKEGAGQDIKDAAREGAREAIRETTRQ